MTYLVAMTQNADDSLRRAEGRKRLQELASAGQERTREQAELERLREYLRMWARAEKSETEQLGAPGGVPFLDAMVDAVDGWSEGADYDERLDRWAREIINTAIDDLLELPDGDLMRAALRVRYLNEGLSREAGFKVRVFRHRRLEGMTLLDADALADRAELTLIPTLKRRGIPL